MLPGDFLLYLIQVCQAESDRFRAHQFDGRGNLRLFIRDTQGILSADNLFGTEFFRKVFYLFDFGIGIGLRTETVQLKVAMQSHLYRFVLNLSVQRFVTQVGCQVTFDIVQ